MRKSKSVKMLLCASAAAGAASIFAGKAMAQASYTFIPNTGAATWATAANWTDAANTSFPQLPGDTANFNIPLAGAMTVTTPSTFVSVGTINAGDTNGALNETLGNFSNEIILDSGVAGTPAVINIAAGTARVMVGAVQANSDVIINVNSASRFQVNNSAIGFNAPGHTVTINGGGAHHPMIVDGGVTGSNGPNTAGLWVVNNGGKLIASGSSYYNNNTLVGDILINPGGQLQNFEPDSMGLNNVVTNNGFWNLGGDTHPQTIGGLAGTAGTWGAGQLILTGNTDLLAGTVPDYSGRIGVSSLTVTGPAKQRLSGTGANWSPTWSSYYTGTGPVLVNGGGVLQLNKTNTAAGTAYAIGSASTYGGKATNTVIASSLTISGAGSTVELMQPNQIAPLVPIELDTGGMLKLDTGSGITTISNTVTIDAASFINVNTERLILTPTAMTSAAAVALLKTGYAGGLWNGPGIMTSAATTHTGLGYNIDGSGDTIIKYTLYGDTNLDGSVNFGDLLTLAQNYNSVTATWATGDFNYDGTVNFADLLALAQNYNGFQAGPTSGLSPSFLADWNLAQSEVAAVPEPASIGLLAIGAAGLLSRRKRASK